VIARKAGQQWVFDRGQVGSRVRFAVRMLFTQHVDSLWCCIQHATRYQAEPPRCTDVLLPARFAAAVLCTIVAKYC
jgi:hypothetical protein